MNNPLNIKISLSCSCILLLAFFYGNAFAAGQSSTSYVITEDVMSGGGGMASSVTYIAQATLGQSSPIGDSASLTYRNQAGFWHFLIRLGDLNGDSLVDLKDIIYGLQVLSDADTDQLYKEADVDGDGKIGIAEVVYILQKIGEVR